MKKYYTVLILIICFFLFFAGTIDLNSLFNYSNQTIPSYIQEDNTPSTNPIIDEGATLGRVLFYDKNLSRTNTVSCGSCHQQAFAFGDPEIQSIGHDGGLTGRHSPRLSSIRFGEDNQFFWDERASSLESQSTMPIQDHIEMGFSGTNGDPDIDSLILKMGNLFYYNELFNLAYGDQTITEERMQNALAQFVRSMQSFDTKYDVGRAQVGNNNANFPNFTTEENNGKALYMSNDDTGCNRCHRAPEFDIDPNSDNNGVITVAGSPGSIDLTNVRSPSLRDIVRSTGEENGPFMHDGSLATLMDVINHYDDIPGNNINLDNRLRGDGGNLNLTDTEKNELLAFLKTLGGTDLYTNEKWSDPFDESGNLELLNGSLPVVLNYFDANIEGEYVHLEWETYAEVNNEGFELLRSQNSTAWEVLDFVYGKGENSTYEYVDVSPFSGTNYYKLKQIDLDGRFDFSEIKYVKIEDSKTLEIYPNPVIDYVNVIGVLDIETIKIYNASGQLVKKVVGFDGSTIIDMTALEEGVYFIETTNSISKSSIINKIVKM